MLYTHISITTHKFADGTVIGTQKRPPPTPTSAKTAFKVFGDQPIKELPISIVIDMYNHNMNAVDQSDQLRASYSGERRVRRGGWHALFELIFHTVLVNCWLLSKHSEGVFKSPKEFRRSLFQALLELNNKAQGKRKRSETQKNQAQIEGPSTPSGHQLQYTSKAVDCQSCSVRSKKRRALELTNQNIRMKCSHYGCKACGVHLCKEGPCFSQYHSVVDS